MKFESQVVHAGDRKRERPIAIPSTTPIHLATTYFYDTAEQLDRIFGHEEDGPSYSRYENPTNSALEELTTTLENGHGSLATCSGMTALHLAFQAALLDRPHSIVSSSSIYGATLKLLDQVIGPFDVNVKYVDICDLAAVEKAIAAEKPGCVFLESISNPVLRVADIPKIAEMAHAVGAAVVVDSTFACPMLMRPLDLGANMVVHSATKYLSGHGDVLGGIIVSDAENHENVRMLPRIPVAHWDLLKAISRCAALRRLRCVTNVSARTPANSPTAWRRTQRWSAFTIVPIHGHPDAATIKQLFAPDLYGAILAFEIKNADKAAVLKFMTHLEMIVPGTSLGDVHTLLLYPVMSSHRDVAPNMRERMGIRENLVRVAAGIEAVEDIYADLDSALRSIS